MPVITKGVKMTKTEYLLSKIIEECADLQHHASKALQFGLANRHPDNPHLMETNAYRIVERYLYIKASMKMLSADKSDTALFPVLNEERIMQRKMESTQQFMSYARDIGTLIPGVRNEQETKIP